MLLIKFRYVLFCVVHYKSKRESYTWRKVQNSKNVNHQRSNFNPFQINWLTTNKTSPMIQTMMIQIRTISLKTRTTPESISKRNSMLQKVSFYAYSNRYQELTNVIDLENSQKFKKTLLSPLLPKILAFCLTTGNWRLHD